MCSCSGAALVCQCWAGGRGLHGKWAGCPLLQELGTVPLPSRLLYSHCPSPLQGPGRGPGHGFLSHTFLWAGGRGWRWGFWSRHGILGSRVSGSWNLARFNGIHTHTYFIYSIYVMYSIYNMYVNTMYTMHICTISACIHYTAHAYMWFIFTYKHTFFFLLCIVTPSLTALIRTWLAGIQVIKEMLFVNAEYTETLVMPRSIVDHTWKKFDSGFPNSRVSITLHK